jgi:hypothetical protein
MTRAWISAAVESYADSGKEPMKPGEQIIKVQMDDGWSVEINAPGKLSPLEAKLKEAFEQSMATGGARSSSRTPSHDIDR